MHVFLLRYSECIRLNNADFISISMCEVCSLLSSLQECEQLGIGVFSQIPSLLSSYTSYPLILSQLLHIISVSHSHYQPTLVH